jgi:O-antigen biosynthesis protein
LKDIMQCDMRIEKIFPSISKLNGYIGHVVTKKAVDIIIPVYNAYEDLLICLNSLFDHFDGYNIILINDCSTDPRVKDLFQSLKDYNSSWIKIIEKNINEGFVKTVNTGFEQSKNDVILLNSDTVVTHNWAKKLEECAYSEDSIATVTPFTNNGTICTVPIFNNNKEMPEGCSIDEFSDFIEEVAFKNYPEIPTAVGFCMFIKREVLGKVGFFDEKTFGEGYGEENDFCMRAKGLGYKSVLCDDTFIFHKGGSSFLDKKDKFVSDHLKILYERYPEYKKTIGDFYRSNPLKENHENIELRLSTWDLTTAKKRILYILHSRNGGTEKHVQELDTLLNQKYLVYILRPSKNGLLLKEHNQSHEIIYKFELDNPSELPIFFSESYKDILEKIVNTFRIDIIHIHQMIGHTFDIAFVAEKYNIPIIYTIHDFYCICPKINLLDENSGYCKNSDNIKRCNRCLSSMGLETDFIIKWRVNFKNILDKSNYIISPSESALEVAKSYYNIDDKKAVVIEHGHPDEVLVKKEMPREDIKDSLDSINIMTLGAIWPYKGEEILYELAKCTYNKPVNWFIIGSCSKIRKRGYDKEHNIYVTGSYKNYEDLLKKIRNNHIQLAVFPSVWPETFCYTLSECWTAGIPPIVSNLGALKERVAKTGCGWAVEPDALSFRDEINKILSNNSQYMCIIKNIELVKLKSLGEMAQEYINLYTNTLKGRSLGEIYSNKFDNQSLFNTIDKTPYHVPILDHEDGPIKRLINCYRDNGIEYTIGKALEIIRITLIANNR